MRCRKNKVEGKMKKSLVGSTVLSIAVAVTLASCGSGGGKQTGETPSAQGISGALASSLFSDRYCQVSFLFKPIWAGFLLLVTERV